MTRAAAIDRATAYFDRGGYRADLDRRVGIHTESQESARAPDLERYLADEITPQLAALGFRTRIVANPTGRGGPFLIADRIEDPSLPTVLTYGHGDVVRGYDAQWSAGLTPWQIVERGERWYGRGTADNKGQHTIVLGALGEVIGARAGRLGFNVKLLMEMGEEVGSPGLREIAIAERGALAADVFIASDGPRVSAGRPTVFLGSRGAYNFDLNLKLRETGHHSGNWGGVLPNPAAILANAIATLVDARGRMLVDGLKPPPIPPAVRAALADIELEPEAGGPEIDPHWGEPGLSPAERIFGWNTLEVLAIKAGNADNPVNAIPPMAKAHCQLRFVVGTDVRDLATEIARHLAARGFGAIEVKAAGMEQMAATRVDPQHPWVQWALTSIRATTGKAPALLPNLGGTLPNDVFTDVLGLPTIWVPHSYPSCAQHSWDEHLLAPVAREGLAIMAGLFWDLGEATSAGCINNESGRR
jgi:acetylornithine deacetylase/succinyl-diaminopimelate desuccinylase-like protein